MHILATGFGKYGLPFWSINSKNGSPFLDAVSKSTILNLSLVSSEYLYSTQSIWTFQLIEQSLINSNVASYSLPVLANITFASDGNPLLDCNILQSIYADVRPPLKLMTVGSIILNGSLILT